MDATSAPKRTFQLFIYRDDHGCKLVHDIYEWEPANVHKHFASRSLDAHGYGNGWTSDACDPEVLVFIPKSLEIPEHTEIGTWRITWGTPAGKRKPRYCVTVDGTLTDLEEFLAS